MTDSLHHHHLLIYHTNLSELKSDSEQLYQKPFCLWGQSSRGAACPAMSHHLQPHRFAGPKQIKSWASGSDSRADPAGIGGLTWDLLGLLPTSITLQPLDPKIVNLHLIIPLLQFVGMRLTLPCLRYPTLPSSTSLRQSLYTVSIATKLTTTLISALSPSAELTMTWHNLF